MAKQWPKWVPVSVVVGFALISFILVLPSISPVHSNRATVSPKHEHHFRAPRANIWADLDVGETDAIVTFLHERPNALNLTKNVTTWGRGDFVNLIEVLRPNKSDAVPYLDNHANIPERWARVVVTQNHEDTAYVSNYMLGPLPVSNNTKVSPLTYPYNSGRNYIQSPIIDYFAFLDWALGVGESIKDITQDLLGAQTNRSNPDDPNGLLIGSRPALIEHGRMIHWLEFFRPGTKSDARSLLPQGLYLKLNTTGPNTDEWSTADWYYNGVLYPNLSSFRHAWETHAISKTVPNLDGPWTDTEDFISMPVGRNQAPPLSIQPYGPRFDLDHENNYISWMGYSFYITISQSTAVSLFDIRFKSNRTIYHLGLQEALARKSHICCSYVSYFISTSRGCPVLMLLETLELCSRLPRQYSHSGA